MREYHRERIIDDHAVRGAAEILESKFMLADPFGRGWRAKATAKKRREEPSVITNISAATWTSATHTRT
jgi:hypothetical protein